MCSFPVTFGGGIEMVNGGFELDDEEEPGPGLGMK